MTKEEWLRIKHFKSSEQWGNFKIMSYDFIKELDRFRAYIANKMIVTAGFDSTKKKHSPNSQHYNNPCKCADFVLPTYPYHPSDLIIDALKFNFTGIGLYFNHKYKGKPALGLHLDQRYLSKNEVVKTWLRSPDGEDVGLTHTNISFYVKKGLCQYLPLKK